MATKTIYTSYTGSTALASIEIVYTYTQNIANNTSTVTASAYAKRLHSGAYGYRNQPVNFALTIDGSVKNHAWTFNMGNVSVGSRIFITSHSKTINHNSDGTHPGVTIKAYSATGTTTFGNINGSMSMGLSTIPRDLKIISLTLSEPTLTTIKIHATFDQTPTEKQFKVNGGSWQTLTDYHVLRELAPGTQHRIDARAKSPYTGNWSEATNYINTVKASVPKYTNRVMVDGIPIGYTRYNSSVIMDYNFYIFKENGTRKLIKSYANLGAGHVYWIPNATMDDIYKEQTKSKRIRYQVDLISKMNGSSATVKGEIKELIFTDRAGLRPTIQNFPYFDENPATQSFLDNPKIILRNRSEVYVEIGDIKAFHGATIKQYELRVGNNSYRKSGNNQTTETGVRINVGKVDLTKDTQIVLVVWDSRGFSGSQGRNMQILDYVAPQFIDNKAVRTNNYEEPSYLVTQNRRSIVKINDIDLNFFSLRFRFKNTNSEAYGAWTTAETTNTNTQGLYQNVTTNEFINDFPNDQSYNIQVQIKDRFTDWQTITILLSEGIALIRFKRESVEVGNNIHVPNGDGTYTLIKKGDDVAIGVGAITDENTIDSKIQLFHNGKIRAVDYFIGEDRKPQINIKDAIILESDSNKNGSYVKFGDGTMICYSKVNTMYSAGTATVTHDFPADFIDNNAVVTPSVSIVEESLIGINKVAVKHGSITSSSVTFFLERSGADYGYYTFTATGRWK